MAKRVETTSLQFEISINGDRKVLKTMKEIRAERRTLIKQLETQSLSQDEYNKKVKELEKLNGVIKDHQQTVRGTGRAYGAAGKAATGFKGLIQGIGPAIKAAFGPVDLILSAVTALVSMGKAAFDAANEMQGVNERVNQLTGLVGEDLEKTSAKVVSLSKTFDTDLVNGIDAANSAANAFLQEGETLGEVYERSLDGIGGRLLGLGDKGDEFLEQIKEYAPQAQQAGLSMDRFFNIVTEGINRGVQTDKLIDSVKEFNFRIKDLSTGQKDALDQVFGKQFTDQIVKDVETGAISAIDALDQIAVATKELGTDSAAAQKVVSNLFGGPGEDATAKYLSLISDVGDELSDVVDTTNVYVQRKQELLRLETESAEATARLASVTDGAGNLFQRVGLIIKTVFVNALASVVEIIRYFPDYFDGALNAGKKFVNNIVNVLELALAPIQVLLDKVFGIELKLPRFDVEDDSFAKVRQKIEADRQKFAERQRQKVLEEEQKTQDAVRLKQLQAQQRRFAELNKARAAEIKKQREIELEAAQAIEDLRIAIMQEGLDKQIALLQTQAQRKIETLTGTEEQIAIQQKLIQEKLRLDIDDLRKKDADNRLKLAKDTADKLKAAEEKAYQDRLATLEAGLQARTLEITQQLVSDVESGIVASVDAEKTLQENLLEAYQEYLRKKKELAEQNNRNTTDIELEQEKKKLDELLKLAQEQADKERQIEDLKTTAKEAGFDFAQGLAEKQFQGELNRIEERKNALDDAEAKALENAGDNRAARLQIEKKYAKEREQLEIQEARKQKQIAIKRSLIEFAIALFKAISAAPPPVNIPLIALQQGLLTIPQGILAAISFGDGGRLPVAGRGGIPSGPSHQDGHIYLVNGQTGQVSGAIEGGEPILSKRTYRNNKPIIDRLLYASMYEGGRQIFADGGFLNSPSTTPTSEVVSNTRSNPEIAYLGEQIGQLTSAYRAGKVVIVGEKEADLFGEMINERDKDKIRRSY